MPIAARTADRVSTAIARARSQPSRSTSRAYPPSAASAARRARIGANRSLTASVVSRLSAAAPPSPISSATETGSRSAHSAASSTSDETSGRAAGW